jgi:hypothetical protein
MRNPLDFSSWQGIVTTLVGLVVISLVAVGFACSTERAAAARAREQADQ